LFNLIIPKINNEEVRVLVKFNEKAKIIMLNLYLIFRLLIHVLHTLIGLELRCFLFDLSTEALAKIP